MWELDCEEGWALKSSCFWTVMLEKALESPLDYKEIQPVNPKENQPWIFTGRTDAVAETPILWPPDVKKRAWCWKRLKAGGEGDNREWDGLMSSPTRWTWVWASSNSWWWTGKSAAAAAAKSLQLCPTLCDPMDCNTPGFPAHHQLLELAQTHVHRVGDAIQPSHPLSSFCPPACKLFQNQSLFQWVSSSHQVANVLKFQL